MTSGSLIYSSLSNRFSMCSQPQLSMQIRDTACVNNLYITAFSKLPNPVLRRLSIFWGATSCYKKEGKIKYSAWQLYINPVGLVRSLVTSFRMIEISELKGASGLFTDLRQCDLLNQLVHLRQLERKFEQGEIGVYILLAVLIPH